MEDIRKDLVKLLVEAHTNELALVSVLGSHVPLAEDGTYRTLLENHLEETKDHAGRLQQRLDDLGYTKNMVSVAYQTAQGLLKQVLVLSKAPVDMVRGGGDVKEKMLRNAMDEAMTEGMEIASYDAIESLALALGDTTTAELAASIRLDEEAMFDNLRKLIPVLAAELATEGPTVIPSLPWEGYDNQTVEEIEEHLRDASIGQLLAVREYEAQNKNRKTVLEAADPANAAV